METLHFDRKTASFAITDPIGDCRSSFSFSSSDADSEGSTILSGSNTPAHETLSIGSPISLILNPDIQSPSQLSIHTISSSSSLSSFPPKSDFPCLSSSSPPLYMNNHGNMNLNRLVSSISYESLPELGSNYLQNRPSSGGLKRCRHSMNLSHLDLAASLGILPNQSSTHRKNSPTDRAEKQGEPRGKISLSFSEDILHNSSIITVHDKPQSTISNSLSYNRSNLANNGDDIEENTKNTTNKRIRLPTEENETDDFLTSLPLEDEEMMIMKNKSTAALMSSSSSVSGSLGLPRVQSAPLFYYGTGSTNNNNTINPRTKLKKTNPTLSSSSVYSNWEGLNEALLDIQTKTNHTSSINNDEQHTGIFDTTLEEIEEQQQQPIPHLSLLTLIQKNRSKNIRNLRYPSDDHGGFTASKQNPFHNLSVTNSSSVSPSSGLKKIIDCT